MPRCKMLVAFTDLECVLVSSPSVTLSAIATVSFCSVRSEEIILKDRCVICDAMLFTLILALRSANFRQWIHALVAIHYSSQAFDWHSIWLSTGK